MPIKKDPEQNYSPRIYTWQVEQIPTEDPNHDALMNAFYNYYKANLHWIQAGTKRSGQDARYWLSEIRHLALNQRFMILDWMKDIKYNPDKCYKPTTKKQRAEYKEMFNTRMPDDNYDDE